jgi:competence protein ComEA
VGDLLTNNNVKGGGMNKLFRVLVVLFGLVAFPAFAAVNINTATQSELESVRGVGPAKAKAIIQYREGNGEFKHINDLDKVKGFGKASIEKLKDELSVSPEKAK